MSTYIVTNPFTSASGAHNIGDTITNAAEITTVLGGGDAGYVVHGADPSPTLNVLLVMGF